MNKIAIASHTALIEGKEYDGIGNVLKESLSDINADYIFVRHSMDGLLDSKVEFRHGNKLKKSSKLFTIHKISPLRYISEISSTVFFFSIICRVNIFIGIDPLNALAGVILKNLKLVDRVIFFTPDYSPKRFNNSALNKIYHKIDNYCIRKADSVWSVSTKIVEIRNKMGLENEKNIFVPNVPPDKFSYLKKNTKDKYQLITYGSLDIQLDFDLILEAVADLKKEIPKIKFVIIGNGPAEERIKKNIKGLNLENNVYLLGHLSLKETLTKTSQSGIGLALYTGKWGFNTFGDSTKCREYLYFGLPIITTDSHSTVEEIIKNGAGVITQVNKDNYINSIKEIFNNYNKYSKAAQKLGNKYNNIHKKLLLELLNDDLK